MSSPRFSVIVPTRERAHTLPYTLQTCLDQDFDDYEILVCDNHSSPATRGAVNALESPRIRYVRTERPLAMSANWEFALTEARGEYLTVIGDDDGLMPFALGELDGLLRTHGSPSAIRWLPGVYTWPDIPAADDANYLMVPLVRHVEWTDARSIISEVINFRRAAHDLPMIYHGLVHRDLVQQHRDLAGRVFLSKYPDIYSAFGFGWLAQRYLSVDVPMSIKGISGSSNGAATLQVNEGHPVAAEFATLNTEFAYAPHPRVPDLRIMPVHVVDSFEFARDAFFPDDEELTYDRQAMTERYLAQVPVDDPAARAQYRQVIRESLTDRPELQEWFDRAAPDPPPSAWFRAKPARFGFDGICLHVDTAATDVADIAGAVSLATRTLGHTDGGPIQYDLPAVHVLDRQVRSLEHDHARMREKLARITAQRDGLRAKYRALRADGQDSAGADGLVRAMKRRIRRS